MQTTDFQAFEADALKQGFDQVLERRWAPNAELETHRHPITAKALVVQGEMWLTCGDATRHLHPGDTFELEPDVPHDERYGAEGATYWVARRNA